MKTLFIFILLIPVIVSGQYFQGRSTIGGKTIGTGKDYVPTTWHEYPPNALYVLLLAGQSNATGTPLAALTYIPAGWQGAKTYCQIYQTASNTFGNINVGTNTYGENTSGLTYWGIEQSLINDIHDSLGKNSICVKNTRSSTALSEWLFPSGTLAVLLKEELDSLFAYCNRNNIAPRVFMVWMQGEADGGSTTTADTYGTRLKTFIENVRSYNSGLSNMPVFMLHLHSFQTVANYKTIDAAITWVTVATPKTYVLDTTALSGLIAGNIHFNDTSLLRMGHKFFSLIKNRGYLK